MATDEDCESDDVLVTCGRRWRADGIPVNSYRCGWNRIRARVAAGDVRLTRNLGRVGTGISVSLDELEPLITLLRWYGTQRLSWSAFYWSGHGNVPGWGFAGAFYQPPGDARQVEVASKAYGKLRGEDFTGEDVRIRVDPPERVADVADLVARIVRKGERFGNRAGEQVGAVYHLGTLVIDAKRMELVLRRGKEWISLEDGEELFLERLLSIERALASSR